ncbi:MAG TPA: hypothetical protein VGE27_15635 [Gemmatimonas sp.]|uniref:hypothetical protein n=1 Tax=Gemmatimonas sp. TaxID=1962908 RepID=UPI002ED8926F
MRIHPLLLLAALPLVFVLQGCAEAAPPVNQTSVNVRPVLRAAEGQWHTPSELTTWRSIVDSGRIVAIHQDFRGPAERIGWRVFRYETAGRLSHFSQGAFGASDSLARRDAERMRDSGLTIETLEAMPEPVRQQLLVVHFLADLPVLSLARAGRQTQTLPRPQVNKIVDQAAELFVRASDTVATAASSRVPSLR